MCLPAQVESLQWPAGGRLSQNGVINVHIIHLACVFMCRPSRYSRCFALLDQTKLSIIAGYQFLWGCYGAGAFTTFSSKVALCIMPVHVQLLAFAMTAEVANAAVVENCCCYCCYFCVLVLRHMVYHPPTMSAINFAHNSAANAGCCR